MQRKYGIIQQSLNTRNVMLMSLLKYDVLLDIQVTLSQAHQDLVVHDHQ